MMDKPRKNGRKANVLFDDTDVLMCDIYDSSRKYMESIEAKKKLEKINSIVGNLGVEIKYDHGFLYILWSENEAKERQSRYAGRPRGKTLTVGQVQEAVASTDTLEEAAASLGISLRTLYRRMRELDDRYPDHKSIVDHYDDVL